MVPYASQANCAKAQATALRRFGETPAEDAREWAKRARYLQYRGFPADLVRRVLKRH
ncbi:MAG: RecX family transcriptional regulator [Xanthomonadaceae bacterium]|nr:RecX family transcriptional regulator [Xanthomonadaceae bacterium]